MELVWNASAVLNVASGLLMAALGALLLLANPRKDWNRLFALLALFWGAQIVTVNTVRLTSSEPLARVAGDLGLVFFLPLYFFIVTFAAIFPRPRPPVGTSGVAIALLAVPAGAAIAVLFAAPEQLIADVIPRDGAFTLIWGPLFPYLVLAPFYAAFFYALFLMMQRLGEAETGIERRQISFVLAALALFAAYNTPFVLFDFGAVALGFRAATEAQAREAATIALTNLVGLVLLAVLARRLAVRSRNAPRRSSVWRRGASSPRSRSRSSAPSSSSPRAPSAGRT